MNQFDSLPSSALVRIDTVMQLFSISAPTVWRWSKSGRLPRPIRISGITGWRVGELRETLGSLNQVCAGKRG